jgi:hypothetical protein
MSSNSVNTLNAASSGRNGASSTANNTPSPSPQEAPATADSPAEVVVVEETSYSSTDDEHARRRRRRRRRRSVRNETTGRRLRIFLFATVVLLVIVALTGGEFRQSVRGVADSVRHILPVAAIKSMFRLEIFALILAALILLYLMPGVEDRVLRALGLKKERRSSRR